MNKQDEIHLLNQMNNIIVDNNKVMDDLMHAVEYYHIWLTRYRWISGFQSLLIIILVFKILFGG